MKKYIALRFVATLHKIVGVLLICVGVGGLLLASGVAGGTTDPAMARYLHLVGFSGLVVCVVAGLFVYAYGELIYVFMDIEENTHKASELRANAQPTSEIPNLNARPAVTVQTLPPGWGSRSAITSLNAQPAVTVQTDRIFCPDCGAVVEAKSIFCSTCGGRLSLTADRVGPGV